MKTGKSADVEIEMSSEKRDEACDLLPELMAPTRRTTQQHLLEAETKK